MRFLIVVLFLGSFASLIFAECQCVCIEGEVQAVCSSSSDIEPICPPRICPITPPSVEPVQKPSVPPIGTKTCVQKQIYNEETRKYEWKEVCY